MSQRPTVADAELILKLYDLRREAELRKARNWWLGFWPEKAEDVVTIATALGTQENAWFRQVSGYWEMAAALVLHRTVNRELFLEPSFCGEMFFIFAKVYPFLGELREKLHSPTAFGNVEQLIKSSKGGSERLQQMRERQAQWRKAAQLAAAS
ncbi:MAG TPA: hypothetical protein VEK33_17915 [Terriglobales bacterium]|nr:hypothetical protein [Terriglobales bacterium]